MIMDAEYLFYRGELEELASTTKVIYGLAGRLAPPILDYLTTLGVDYQQLEGFFVADVVLIIDAKYRPILEELDKKLEAGEFEPRE